MSGTTADLVFHLPCHWKCCRLAGLEPSVLSCTLFYTVQVGKEIWRGVKMVAAVMAVRIFRATIGQVSFWMEMLKSDSHIRGRIGTIRFML